MTKDAAPTKGNPTSAERGKEGEYWETSDWTGYTPHCIYFYYFKPSSNGYENTYYFYDNGDANPIDTTLLQTKITDLVTNAATGGNTPSPEDTKFGEDDWIRISWLVIAVEGLDFSARNAVKIKHRKHGQDKSDNHSFFDGDTSVKQVAGKTIGVLWMHNHMRDRDGELLPQKSQDFNFKFKRKEREVFEFEENGTNTGPPVTPPPSPPPPPIEDQ